MHHCFIYRPILPTYAMNTYPTIPDDALAVPPPLPEELLTLIDRYDVMTGGELTAETMQRLNVDQLTLYAYHIVRREVMQGGFIQLIYNGYGGFIFHNPFAKVIRQWGLDELATLINKARKYEQRYGEQIASAQTDDDFMALYEQMPQFDDCDDAFVEKEEMFTSQVAAYVRQHSGAF